MIALKGNMKVSGNVSINPTVLRNNLIFEIDAGNAISYPGYGNTWYDLSESKYNVTLINSPTYNRAGYLKTNGTSSYMELNNETAIDFGISNFTIEYWVRKLVTTTGYDNIFGVNKWTTALAPSQCEFSLAVGNGVSGVGNTFQLSVCDGTNVYSTGQSLTALAVNVWQHVVGIRSGNLLITYLNGVLQRSITPSGFTTSTSIANVTGRKLRICADSQVPLGSNDLTQADSGIVRIYSNALSQTQVLNNFNANRSRFGI